MEVECRVIAMGFNVPYWIRREVYYKHFDQHDARLLLPEKLKQGYLIEWFSCDEKGSLAFTMPGAHFVKGKTEFFNGRHRTALLLEHLDEVPIAFETKSDGEKHLLDVIPKRPVESNDRFYVPDLPIWKDEESMAMEREPTIMLSQWAADPKIRNEMDPPPNFQNLQHIKYCIDWGSGKIEF